MLTIQMSTLVARRIAAELLLHSFWRVSRVDPGFDTTNVAVIQMSLDAEPGDPHWRQRAVEFSEQVRERIAALPGVAVAAVSSTVPFEGIHARALGLRYETLTPMGRHLQWGDGYEIVGVVEEVRWVHPERPAAPAFYLPFAQNPGAVVRWSHARRAGRRPSPAPRNGRYSRSRQIKRSS